MTMTALLTWTCFVVAQAAPAAQPQHAWLQGFEGTWVLDNPRDSEADVTLTVALDGNVLVLTAVVGTLERQTRYELSGSDQKNRRATFRTRIEGHKLVTEIWDAEPVGPPDRIETRYLESADRMMTELSRTAGGPAFNRTLLRRK